MSLSPHEQEVIKELLTPFLDQLTSIAESLERIADLLEVENELEEDEDA